jgi:ABC-type multidrug transport system fused ATPase/permease subunit
MPSPKRKQGYVVVPTTDEDADGTTPVAVEAVEMSSGLASKPAKAHSAGRRSPAERAGWVSQLFFRWLSPIFTLGASATLQPEDLDGWPLRTSDNPAEQAAAMDRAWRSAAAAAGPTAEVPFKAVCWAAFGRRYMAVGLCKVPYWVALFAQPLILRALLAAISTTGGEEQGPEALGALVVGLGLSTLGISLSSMHLFVWAQTMGMNVRAGIGSLIYTQALRLRPAALAAAAGPSEVLTLLSADTERIVNALSFFHFLYTAPIEIGGALFLAWQQLGSAAVAGLGVMLLLSPLQTFLGNRIGRLRKSAVRHTDERVRTIAECLHGIGTVKLLCAEQLFLKRVSASREREIRTLRRAAVAKMCNAAAAFTTQMLVALATFSLHVYLQPDEPPRPEQLFSGLACFNVINNTLSMVPRATEALAEAMVASSRISAFLNLAEQSRMSAHRAQSSRVARSAADEDEVVAIALRGVSFSWAELEGSSSSGGSAGSAAGSGDGLCLRDINAEIGKGQLTAVIGPVGAGKSSFLAGLLGELELMRTTPTTKAQRDGDSHANAAAVEWLGLAPEAAVAFVAQTPFLLQASVRENIVLQHPYVADRYAAVVSACGMSRDITGMAAGDATEVSEGGSSLSGGQQMRLSLARAVYGALSAEKPGLVLLDDPLSALDNHLGRHVFEQCICGLLKGHTVVMATHAVHFLHAVDRVILLDSGIVQCVGAPSVLEESQHPLATAYRAAGTPEPEPELEPESELEPGAEGAAAGQKAVTIPDTEKRNTGTGAANLTSKEDRTAGAVVWDTYATYVRAAGGGWSALMVVALYVVGQLVFLGGDLWLAGWADRNSALGSGQQHQQQQAQLCDLAACRCGPYDLSTSAFPVECFLVNPRPCLFSQSNAVLVIARSELPSADAVYTLHVVHLCLLYCLSVYQCVAALFAPRLTKRDLGSCFASARTFRRQSSPSHARRSRHLLHTQQQRATSMD